jgi:hypothetical protein
VDWMHVAQDRDQLGAVVNTAVKLRRSDYQLLKKDCYTYLVT